MNTERKLSTREKVAAGISGAIVLVTVIYWITQIVGAIEMLNLAYG
jgi:hypothetical protein